MCAAVTSTSARQAPAPDGRSSSSSPSSDRGAHAEVLVVDSLVKRYGATVAADGMSLVARAGEVTALLGPNGAGKTTAVECCVGLRRPDGGSVRVLGLDPVADAAALRPQVGVMLQDGGLPGAVPALRVLRHVASLHTRPLDVDALARALGIDAFAATATRRLSGGQRQRLALACAVVGRPDLVLLDEPSAGVDLAGRQVVRALVDRLRRAGAAVVMTTHSMEEVEALADTVVVVAAGSVVAAGTVAALTGDGTDRLAFRAPAGLPLEQLRLALPTTVVADEVRPGTYEVVPTADGAIDPQVLATVTSWCAARSVMPRDLSVGRRSLEDVVLELTGGADAWASTAAAGPARTRRRRGALVGRGPRGGGRG